MTTYYAPSPCMGDWDGDGDLDMALGFIDGPVRLFKNNGDLTFTEAGPFKVDGKPLEANDAGPCMVDWDRDGKLDLLLGDSEGNLQFFKGQGNGSMSLTTNRNRFVLSKVASAWTPRKLDAKSTTGFSPVRPGGRLKPYAADWNGDGKLDLLVGDYIDIEKAPRILTKKENAEAHALEAKQQRLSSQLSDILQPLSKKAWQELGVADPSQATNEQRRRWSNVYGELYSKHKELRKIELDLQHVSDRLADLRPGHEGTGLVWVYLRK